LVKLLPTERLFSLIQTANLHYDLFRRFKEEIKPMNNASEALFSLKPVNFHYKKRD